MSDLVGGPSIEVRPFPPPDARPGDPPVRPRAERTPVPAATRDLLLSGLQFMLGYAQY